MDMSQKGRKSVSPDQDVSRRAFMKSVATTGLVLATSIAGVGLFPKAATAQGEMVTAYGKTMEVRKVTKTFAEMRATTRLQELFPETSTGKYYTNLVEMPGGIKFDVQLFPKKQEGNQILINFPKQYDKEVTSGDSQGGRKCSLADLNEVVRSSTPRGQTLRTLERVEILTRTGSFQNDVGQDIDATVAYAFPISRREPSPIYSDSRYLTQFTPGRYVAQVVSVYVNKAESRADIECFIAAIEPPKPAIVTASNQKP